MSARARVLNGDGIHVVFTADNFYTFCLLLWEHGVDQMEGKARPESIEDTAEPLVVKERIGLS